MLPIFMPVCGHKETVRGVVDGRTRKRREIGDFALPLVYESDSENWAERTERSEGAKPVRRPSKDQIKPRLWSVKGHAQIATAY